MDKQFLQTLKGFRDFLPKEAKKRQYLKDKIRQNFELFGFEPLETPTLEYEELLMGKYGDEADKLVFRFTDEGGRKVAMRYDQTVPTSRVLSIYNQQLPMPWRRYQIQEAYRAENTQKGRFREFTQCDADIFGTTSPLSDAEILACGSNLLSKLGFKNYKILINDRAILFYIMSEAKIPENLQLSAIQTIDKLDKKTRGEVEAELEKKGLSLDNIHLLFDLLEKAKPTELLQDTIDAANSLGVNESVIQFQPTLARGLDYYTSIIYEFIIEGYSAGSVCGGGRYDKLINKLSGIDIPATGYSWGFDRLIEAMEQFGLFPPDTNRFGIIVSVFNSELTKDSLSLVANLRDNGLASEIYPNDQSDLKKQLKYADKKGIKWFLVIGPEEVNKNTVILKNLESGFQDEVKLSALIETLKNR